MFKTSVSCRSMFKKQSLFLYASLRIDGEWVCDGRTAVVPNCGTNVRLTAVSSPVAGSPGRSASPRRPTSAPADDDEAALSADTITLPFSKRKRSSAVLNVTLYRDMGSHQAPEVVGNGAISVTPQVCHSITETALLRVPLTDDNDKSKSTLLLMMVETHVSSETAAAASRRLRLMRDASTATGGSGGGHGGSIVK